MIKLICRYKYINLLKKGGFDMKNKKNSTFIRILWVASIIAFNLFNNVKATGINADEEVFLLRKMLKEEREANKARVEYYEKKLGKIAGITMTSEESETEKIPVKEKITSDAHQNLTKMLKKPFLNLLALTALTQPERLKLLVEEAEKALKEYKDKFVVAIKVEKKETEVTPPAEIPTPMVEEKIAPKPEEPKAEEMMRTPPIEIPTPPTEKVVAPIIEKEIIPSETPEIIPAPIETAPSPVMPETAPAPEAPSMMSAPVEITPSSIPVEMTPAPATQEMAPTMPEEVLSPQMGAF